MKKEIDEVEYCVNILNEGGVILYPTDTIWGLGCDATNSDAVNKVFKIKNREKGKSMLLLCSGIEQLSNYVEEIPSKAKELIEMSTRPLSIIYPKGRNLPEELLSADGSIGFRIPKNDFCLQLINRLGKPIVSTSANFSNVPPPFSFSDISEDLMQRVDYVVNEYRDAVSGYKNSRIVKISESNRVTIIRD